MRTSPRLAALIVSVLLIAPAWVVAQAGTSPKRVLFLTHAGLYKHPSLEPAEIAVTAWGKTAGFEVTTHQGFRQDAKSLDLSFLTTQYLAGFDGLMLMTNGNLPLTAEQKRAIVDFVRGGGALIGVHCATLTMYDDTDFGEILGGYYLRSIVPTDMIAKGKVGVLKVEDPTHPATRMLGSTWPINEEFYEFGRQVWDASRPTENLSAVGRLRIMMPFSRDRVRVLLSLDTDRTDLSDLPNVPQGDYPQAWVKETGRGRTFYTSLGHREDIWAHDAVFRAHVTGGIRWALGLEH